MVPSGWGTDSGAAMEEYYPFQTLISSAIPIPGPSSFVKNGISDSTNTFDFKPGANSTLPNLTVKLCYGSSNSNAASGNSALQALQTYL